MLDLFLPIHDTLQQMLGEKLCCWPGVFGFCPEFWFGFSCAWALVKSEPHKKFVDVLKKYTNKDESKD